MMNHSKYRRQYYMPPYPCMKWAEKDYVDKAPVWCSVDLRDGNQALVVPMTLEQKIGFFKLLCKVGFKEIEVGFPAASETEYTFLRALIEQNLIPDDVTIQVLTQAREHIIRKTFEALEGAKQAIVHVYNSTSVAQREQVFHKSKEEILKIAVDGAELLKMLTEEEKFNRELFYLLHGLTLEIPSLGERKEDLNIYIDRCIEENCRKYNKHLKLTKGGKEKLLNLPWEGNAIQIQSFCERLVLDTEKRNISETEIQKLYSNL